MLRYSFGEYNVDSVELKCLLISRGLKIAPEVYKSSAANTAIPSPQDVAEVVRYTIENDGVDSIQITGGSTFKSEDEERYITAYMTALCSQVGRENIKGEVLLYITPPENSEVVDRYFELGADRIACSLEVWDNTLADLSQTSMSMRERQMISRSLPHS